MVSFFCPPSGAVGLQVQDSRLNGLAVHQQIVIAVENHLRSAFIGDIRVDETADVGFAEPGGEIGCVSPAGVFRAKQDLFDRCQGAGKSKATSMIRRQ